MGGLRRTSLHLEVQVLGTTDGLLRLDGTQWLGCGGLECLGLGARSKDHKQTTAAQGHRAAGLYIQVEAQVLGTTDRALRLKCT